MIIIARFNEDISWAKDKEHFVVQKGEHLPNHGREPSSFLWYIINNYDSLKGEYTFLQGNPFDHPPYVDVWLETSKYGCPHHANLPWSKFMEKSGIDLPIHWNFRPGGQFTTTAEEIKRHPKSFYENLYKMVEEEEIMAWILERIWGIILKVV